MLLLPLTVRPMRESPFPPARPRIGRASTHTPGKDPRVTSEFQHNVRIWKAWFREDWQRIARAAVLLLVVIAGVVALVVVVAETL